MVACADQRWWGCILVAQPEHFADSIPDAENKDCLNEQRNRNPEDGERIGKDGLPLEGEQQYQRRQQGDNGNRSQNVQEFLLKQASPLYEIIHFIQYMEDIGCKIVSLITFDVRTLVSLHFDQYVF